ncbi:hypothetical protein [Cellulophaga sp. BC115SP]|uniref:hypothetical protein n=1 Tax=Cellulophaga sp. BC115SP TaxID=2683263 RepID=UPI001413495A|nr:hypothetical protein [Cellulophaga sp. BC115SP]NBB31935.1 hypothetical protein [Cellulophaga sp. BC115SP]
MKQHKYPLWSIFLIILAAIWFFWDKIMLFFTQKAQKELAASNAKIDKDTDLLLEVLAQDRLAMQNLSQKIEALKDDKDNDTQPDGEVNNHYSTTVYKGVDFQEVLAGEYIVKGRLITIKNGLAYHFNSLLEENYLKATGISLDNAPVGETLHIQVEGVVEIANWGLAVNTNYYAGPAGQLMPSAPDGSTTQGVTQSVGLSLTPEKLNLDFSVSIINQILT